MKQNVKKKETYIPSSNGRDKLHVIVWIPQGEIKAVLQISHGMIEDMERYDHFARFMAARGILVCGNDHLGHGLTARNKSEMGYMYAYDASKTMAADVHRVTRCIKRAYPDLPYFLMGHSMGSLAVRAFAARHDESLDMLIICGSPSENKARTLGQMIATAEKKIFGPRHRSRLLETLSFGNYVMKFSGEKNKNAWICSDKEVYRAYTESELCGFTFTDDAYLALFDLMKQAYDVVHWQCRNSGMPVLFVSGAEDPCLGNVRKFAGAVHAMRRAGYLDVKGKLYPRMRHEILNEKGKEKVYHDILVYLHKKGF